MNLYNIRKKTISSPSPPPPPTPKKDETSKHTMIWGKPTWFLFHALAEKVSEERFEEIRAELLDIIYSICTVLPCPICREHAKEYMKKINFNAITSRDKLKRMLFEFHNSVNQRKEAPLFSFEELQKYETANLKHIIYHFMHVYSMNSHNIKFVADDIYKKNVIQKIKNWIQSHTEYFQFE